MPYSILKIENFNGPGYSRGMKRCLVFLFFTTLLVGLGTQVWAGQTNIPPGSIEPPPPPPTTPIIQCGGPANPCDLCDLLALIPNIVNFLLVPTSSNKYVAIVPLIATVLTAVGGFYFLISSGSPQGQQKGRTILTAVVVGLIIVYGSWLFVNFLFQALGVAEWVGISGFGKGTGLWQIQCNSQ